MSSEIITSEGERTESLDRLVEVSRLATLLADQGLNAQITGCPIPDSHIRSLLEASLLLRECEVDLTPLLSQIMRAVDQPEA